MENIVVIVMLVLGVILFAAGLYVLKVLLDRKKSLTPSYALFALAICMVGFSLITNFKIAGVVEFDKTAGDYQRNPNSTNAQANFEEQLDAKLAAGDGKPLAPKAEAELQAVVADLSTKTNLTPESKITLSKAQLLLGKTNAAQETLKSAIAIRPDIAKSARIRVLKPVQ